MVTLAAMQFTNRGFSFEIRHLALPQTQASFKSIWETPFASVQGPKESLSCITPLSYIIIIYQFP